MNPNPKLRAENKFLDLFGDAIAFKVSGHRENFNSIDRHGYYKTCLIIDDMIIAEAIDEDWRQSYKKLSNKIEKLYADGLALV